MDQDTLLSISHLHKQFADIKQNQPSIGSSQSANELHEQKIYNILPLFCKIFNNNQQQQQQINDGHNHSNTVASNIDIFETFADATTFTQMVSRLMVTEIRRRASNKTTELASLAIVKYLEISPTICENSSTNSTAPNDHNKKGWILLSTLNILVSFNSTQLISIMTNNSLASTLVKCLYLFFDLPPFDDDDDDNEQINNNVKNNDKQIDKDDYYLTNNERRQLLQKIFSQLLQRLCITPQALNDLIRKDDLILLFNVITSYCPKHNQIWRKIASDTIIIMSKYGNINIDYIHSKKCINLFIDNIQRIVELGTISNEEIILMIRTLVMFMYELVNYYQNLNINQSSSNQQQQQHQKSIQILLDDFNECFGYQFFVDYALKLEQQCDNDENQLLLNELLDLIIILTKIGLKQHNNNDNNNNNLNNQLQQQIFVIENFTLPKPSLKNSIKNLKAFNIIQSIWQKCRTSYLQFQLLKRIQFIFNEDRYNYFLLESSTQNILSIIGDQLNDKNEEIQILYYQLIEFIVNELNYVPCKELITIGIILKKCNNLLLNCNDDNNDNNYQKQQLQHQIKSSLLALKTLNKMLKYNSIFKDVFREVGLVDIICQTFNTFVQLYEQQHQHQDLRENIEINLNELLEILIQLMIVQQQTQQNINQNCQIFHDIDSITYLFQLIKAVNISTNHSDENQNQTSPTATTGRESSQSFTLTTNYSNGISYHKLIRKRSLILIQQLILLSNINSEENLSQLLVLLHKDRQSFNNINELLLLKLSVLKSLLYVLREQHRIRALFRKIGGFVSVISVIVHMENYLNEIPSKKLFNNENIANNNNIDNNGRQIWNLLCLVFATITTAMRFEPANSKYFAQEICSPSFTDSLRLLGCFDEIQFGWRKLSATTITEDDNYDYDKLFNINIDELLTIQRSYNKNECACILMRLLFDMTMDQLDRNQQQNHQQQQFNSEIEIIIYPCIIDTIFQLLKFIESRKLCKYLMEKLCQLLQLERNCQVICECCCLITELMQSPYLDLFLDDSNQIINPLIRYVFECLSSHHIQPKDLRTFLRLSNPLSTIPLDEFNKISKLYRNHNNNDNRLLPLSRIKSLINISKLPLINNDNITLCNNNDNKIYHSYISPPFTEFDMNPEGFSCIFIPSIAPVSTAGTFSNSPSSLLTGAIVGNSDMPVLVNGGIGTGERAFPSQSGLSFTSWIYIERYDLINDNHTMNILTLYRSTQPNSEYSCLKAYINLNDKTMTISTQELPIFSNNSNQPQQQMNLYADQNAKFPIGEFITTKVWHHIVIVLNRALLKNSTINIYIDGQLRLSKKLSYISSIVGGSYGIANTSPLYINGFIGTPPHYRKQRSKLSWKQGPCHLIEESLSASFVSYIYMLGPNYIGSFQAITYKHSSLLSYQNQQNHQLHQQQQQLAEDRLIFGLNARATSIMTLSKMRRVYSKFDCKQIAKIIGLSTHENATPIYVLHNSAGHLCGPSRPLGGVLIGNIGARCFIPKPISLTISDIGGTYLLLGLIANSNDSDTLLSSCKVFAYIIQMNSELQLEMNRINGYQILSVLLKRKRLFINEQIFSLFMNLIENLDRRTIINQSINQHQLINTSSNNQNQSSYCEYTNHYQAFKEIFIDTLDLWLQCNLLKKLLTYINENILLINNKKKNSIIENSIEQQQQQAQTKILNINHLCRMNLLQRLLLLFKDGKHQELLLKDENLIQTIMILIYRLSVKSFNLNASSNSDKSSRNINDLLFLGQFIVSLLPIQMDEIDENGVNNSNQHISAKNDSTIELINSLLKIILQLISRQSTQQLNLQIQDELIRILGFDWFLIFISNNYKLNVNIETITIGLVNLMLLLSNPILYCRFREGQASYNGNWLKNLDMFIENRSTTSFQLAGFNISTSNKNSSNQNNQPQTMDKNLKKMTKIQQNLFTIPGFQHLNWLLINHIYEPKIYLIIFQTIFGHYKQLQPKTLNDLDLFEKLSLDKLIKILIVNDDQKQFKQMKIYGKDLIISILIMVNKICCDFDHHQQYNDKYNEYPVILINFLKYIYNYNRDFRHYCQTNMEFLQYLCRSLIIDDDRLESTTSSTTNIELKLIEHHPVYHLICNFIMEIFINIINTNPFTFSSSSSMTSNQSLQSFFINNKTCLLFNNLLNYMIDCRRGQTKLMSLFIDYVFKSFDFNQPQPQHSQQLQQQVILNFQSSYSNIVLLMSTIVDKLWQNCYLDDRKKIIECLLRLLKIHSSDSMNKSSLHGQQQTTTNKTSLKNLTSQLSELNLLYKSINRTILYLISRSSDTMSDRIQLFEILQLILTNKQLILISKCNNDNEFFACLTYCLLQLIQDERICLTPLIINNDNNSNVNKSQTTWYIDNTAINSNRSSHTMQQFSFDKLNDQNDEGTLLIQSTAKKIWQEIFICRRTQLEDTLKIQLQTSNSSFGIETNDIEQFRDQLYEPSLKIWSNYLDQELQKIKRKLQQQQQQQQQSSSSPLSFDSLSSSNILTEKLTNINKLNNLVTKSAGGFVSKIVGGTSGVVGNAIQSAVGTTRKDVFRSSLSSDSSSSESINASLAIPIPVWTLMSKNDVLYSSSLHELIVKNFINFNAKQKQLLDYNLRKYIYNEWLNNEYEFLTRERAIWGPLYGSKRFDKWMLDMTEGPNRMRKKMIRNDEFYVNYPFRPEMENTGKSSTNIATKFRSPISLDSKDYYRRIYLEKKFFHLDKDDDIQSFEYDLDDIICTSISDESTNRSKTSLSNNDDLNDQEIIEHNDNNNNSNVPSSDSLDIFESEINESNTAENTKQQQQQLQQQQQSNPKTPTKDNSHDDNTGSYNNEMQTILRLLEDGEKITNMFRVARVQGLDSYEGLLLFGKEHFYLIDGFTLLKTKEIKDIDSLPPGIYDSIIPNSSNSSSVSVFTAKKVFNKFSYEDIREVHKRRYLLQPIALEVFSMDGRNSLMVFPRNLRNKVYARFLSVAVHITDNAQDSLMGQKRNVNVETGGILSNIMGDTSVTQRWVRGEISNFQYLMNLNTLAGRSYNDLMQYPVFPWIVADYDSYDLDLNNPASFRDLSKPMGAQTPERLEQFRKRFSEWDNDTNIKAGDELIQGAYHYGTFYSSAMIVASYLVRIEPFTQHFLRLQGGHFDLADRMFHSIGDSWLSASKHNMADLKELIPEFFYLPEFLINSNRYDFGCKQNGTRLNDVVLPKWAKGDPREFIRVHRAALESDYVSAHLHEWIDLIFGYKQNGPAAIEAVNVFHHLFYEGNADIYNIDDPLKKNATIGFINNFGQVPMQLFKKPHPQKKAFQNNSSSNISTPLISSFPPLLSSVNLSGSTNVQTSKIFIHNLEYLKPMMHPIKELKGAVGQIVQQDKTILAVEQNKVLIPPLYNRCVAWGFADHSFRIGPYESDRALYVWESELYPPNGEILCTTVPNSRIIITAGTNSVIYVWRVKNKSLTLRLHQKLYGHTEAVTCLASSSAYGIIVSGSRDKTCIIWDLNRFVFIRQLGGGSELVHRSPIAAAAINDLTGDIATCCSTMLYLWSINGDLVAQINTVDCSPTSSCQQNSSQILCLAFSSYNEWDPDNVILTGSSDGIVKMWTLRYVQEKIIENENDVDGEKIRKKSPLSSSSSSTSSDQSSNDDESSLSEELKNSISLNPSKDEIVRRLSIVSTKNEEDSEDNDYDDDDDDTADSVTPVDEEKINLIDWNNHSNQNKQQQQQQQHPIQPPKIALTHSESFNEKNIEKFNPHHNKQKKSSSSSSKKTLGNSLQANNNAASIRNSKSDTALAASASLKTKTNDKSATPSTSSTIAVAKNNGNELIFDNENNPCLKQGYRWITKLIFCSKLTMHTAYERKDNKDPAAITCIAISKDHRNLFIGDARGRIFCWSVNENKNLAADHWIKDDVATNCTNCSIRFSITERKHHCRNCGKVFCARCSRFEATIIRLKIMKPVRVCQNCYIFLQQQQQQQQ